MKERSSTRWQQLMMRWVWVLVPTLLIGFITLRFLNFSYTALQTGLGNQTFYFGIGLWISYSLYFFRARWLVSVALLALAYFIVDKIITFLPGEFDVFYATARFQLYSTLFLFGWAFGFLLIKLRWAYVLIFALLATVTLVSVSDTVDLSLQYILLHVAPVLVYGLYMYFLSPLLVENATFTSRKSGKLLLRTVLFALLVLLALVATERLLRGELQAVEKELAARGAQGDKDRQNNEGGYDERYGLMEKDDDGYRLKDTMRVNSRMSQSDKLMFCSKLDNFYPDGTPIPLYFVYHYLTRYDPVKESFTRDVNVPSFDELEVDPTELPMYYSFTDTSIIRKSKGNRYRKLVEAQVYLSENTWKHSVLGPASVFSIQTIPVEKDFQKTFLSAYKIYSYTSDLNNAYFVYNISASPQLEPLQEQRHEELRVVENYTEVDKAFMDYYTQMPSGGIYDSIARLAQSLVPRDAAPVDKVLAVRDFFLQRNENGKMVFRYTLNAGAIDDPNIPSSKMLYDFLFKTHAGYCTYYAGASHFMLRALGVPTRFTTGFATVNRSDKNKGWYWFYASQAHAWTQVYFPEYGWLDFDMTIGNEDQQGAPKPDGTPPLPPPDPWLVLNAKVETADATSKSLSATFKSLLFHNTPFELANSEQKDIDATLCRVLYGDKDTTFQAIQPGDSVIIVSYKDEAKRIPPLRPGVKIEQQVAGFPTPIIADEIHIRPREKEEKKKEDTGRPAKQEEPKIDWKKIGMVAAKLFVSLILLLIFAPLLFLLYRLLQVALANKETARADEVYRMALYRLHMAGVERGNDTPLHYAQQKVDPLLGTSFANFMRLYLRLKYTQSSLRPGDGEIIEQSRKELGPALHRHFGWGRITLNYFNLLQAWRYFQQPADTDNENSTL